MGLVAHHQKYSGTTQFEVDWMLLKELPEVHAGRAGYLGSKLCLTMLQELVGQSPRKSPGWRKQSSPGQCSFRFGCVEEGSTQGRWCLPIGYIGGRLNTRTVAAVPLAIALKPHKSIFPYMPLAPLNHCPSAGAQGVPVSE